MFDLPYIVTHPLVRKITLKCAVLQEQAMMLPEGSEQRTQIERRLSQLEQFKLPKPTPAEAARAEPIIDEFGRKIGERYSLRRRFRAARRGRPEKYTIKVRAALEEKLANGNLTWSMLATKHGFKNRSDLERAARRLRVILRREGILPLTPEDTQSAQQAETFLRSLGK